MTADAILFWAFWGLLLALVPFVLPIASLVMQRRLRRRLLELEQLVAVLTRCEASRANEPPRNTRAVAPRAPRRPVRRSTPRCSITSVPFRLERRD